MLPVVAEDLPLVEAVVVPALLCLGKEREDIKCWPFLNSLTCQFSSLCYQMFGTLFCYQRNNIYWIKLFVEYLGEFYKIKSKIYKDNNFNIKFLQMLVNYIMKCTNIWSLGSPIKKVPHLTAPEAPPALDLVAMVLAGALAAAPPEPTLVALADCVWNKHKWFLSMQFFLIHDTQYLYIR